MPPVLGRPSAASAQEPQLGAHGEAVTATYRAEGGSTDWCTLRAATVTGVRHRLAGEPGQDGFAWAIREGLVALAVTDGIGAVEGSERAAAAAASAAVEAAVAYESDRPELGAAGAVGAAVQAANSACVGEGATTLVVAVIERDGEVVLGRVGDSTAFIVGTDGPHGPAWSELFEVAAANSESIGVETEALPSDEPEVEVSTARLEGGDILVLASDGVADPWRDGPTTVAPAFTALISQRPAPLALAAAADFSRQGCHDDRTIVLLWL